MSNRRLRPGELGAGAGRKGVARGAACTDLEPPRRWGFCGMVVTVAPGISRNGIVNMMLQSV